MRVSLLTLITFVLLLATNPRVTHPNAAQSDSALATIMMESQEGTTFYRLVEGNQLEQVGTLPNDFSIERSPEAEWQLLSWPGINLTLSPDGEYIAFTLRNEADSSGFFVYSIAENTVDEVFVTSPMSFSLQFEWSSDSSAVLLQPIGCECSGYMYPFPETYVYSLPLTDGTPLPTHQIVSNMDLSGRRITTA